MIENEVILVDENDQPIGAMEKLEAHEKALLHRAISVIIYNPEGKWLLQQRTFEKYHSKGLWTNTACSHPYPGEITVDAAARRLAEEMGITADLKEIFSFTYKQELENGLTEHELDHVFVGYSNQTPVPHPEEVRDYKFVSTDELTKDITENPEKYTVWFKIIFNRVCQFNLNQSV